MELRQIRLEFYWHFTWVKNFDIKLSWLKITLTLELNYPVRSTLPDGRTTSVAFKDRSGVKTEWLAEYLLEFCFFCVPPFTKVHGTFMSMCKWARHAIDQSASTLPTRHCPFIWPDGGFVYRSIKRNESTSISRPRQRIQEWQVLRARTAAVFYFRSGCSCYLKARSEHGSGLSPSRNAGEWFEEQQISFRLCPDTLQSCRLINR